MSLGGVLEEIKGKDDLLKMTCQETTGDSW
jgi:hypothetical protein